MSVIDEGQKFSVVVDYAHTPESFEKVFNELKPTTKGKLIAVFGSAGRRDAEKRPKQGEVAGRHADIVIITEEDDRDMPGEEILEDIAKGARKAGKKDEVDLFKVHDRFKAVEFALSKAGPQDTVVFLGKGHEKSILRNGPMAAELRHLQQDDSDQRRVTKIEFDEVSVVRAALKKL